MSPVGQEGGEASWGSSRGSVASWGLRRARVQEGPSLGAWGSRSGCRVQSRLVTQGRGRGPQLEALEPEPSRASGAAPWSARFLRALTPLGARSLRPRRAPPCVRASLPAPRLPPAGPAPLGVCLEHGAAPQESRPGFKWTGPRVGG